MNAMRFPVLSSKLKSVGYDGLTGVLEIEFLSGGIYEYHAVPREIFSGLMGAGSKGRYFHAKVMDRYRCVKVG